MPKVQFVNHGGFRRVEGEYTIAQLAGELVERYGLAIGESGKDARQARLEVAALAFEIRDRALKMNV